MASWNGSSLTPSRPAPPVPGGGSSNGLRPLLTTAHSSSSFNNGSSGSLSRGVSNLSLSSNGPSTAPSTPSGSSGRNSFFGQSSNNTSSLVATGSVLREGQVSIKEDGIRSMFFSKRWALLRQNALTFHKNREVSKSSAPAADAMLKKSRVLILFIVPTHATCSRMFPFDTLRNMS